MKKIAIGLIVVVAIVSTFIYFYYNYKKINNEAKKSNIEYSEYQGKQITGNEVASLINKAVSSNMKNNVEKDEKGNYKSNETNSINIDIEFLDDEKVHTMEEIFDNGTNTFVEYYGTIEFECTKVEYHQKTSKISYMLIKQKTI